MRAVRGGEGRARPSARLGSRSGPSRAPAPRRRQRAPRTRVPCPGAGQERACKGREGGLELGRRGAGEGPGTGQESGLQWGLERGGSRTGAGLERGLERGRSGAGEGPKREGNTVTCASVEEGERLRAL